MGRQTHFVDTLIVGQGLAGSLLAWELIRRGQRVRVVDPPPARHDASASRVAGGIISPLSGRRFTPAPELGTLITRAADLYADIESSLGVPVFRECPIWRILNDELEVARLAKRQQDPACAPYLGEQRAAGELADGLVDPHGSVCIRGARVDLPGLLERLRHFFRDSDRLEERTLPYEALSLQEEGIAWEHYRAGQLIFCEGFRVRHNPWFDWAPVRPSRGEILTVEITNAQLAGKLPKGILNAGKWLIPLGANRYLLGATYGRDRTGAEPTAAGREELLTALARLLPEAEVRVHDHRAGVRPGKTDHYPVLGRHPHHPRLAIFNGLGSRGALSAPHYARLLARHLDQGTAIPQAADAGHWHARQQAAES